MLKPTGRKYSRLTAFAGTEAGQERRWKDQSTEALNFHITVGIAYIVIYIVGFILLFVLIGIFVFLLIPVLWVVQIIYGIQGYQAANRGEYYRYPFAFRLVKP